MYNLLGKEVRGRLGFPSGEIATNSDTARWIIDNIPQIGWIVGKSTTIKSKEGNPEDIFLMTENGSGWNAVGFTNPGLEATVESFKELKRVVPRGVFLMPQIGEENEEGFRHCIEAFEELGDVVDGYELNISCGHAKAGGINLGYPDRAYSIVSTVAKTTRKPIIVKINATSPDLVLMVKRVVEAGARAISLINTIPGPYPELSNEFGGHSGPDIFQTTYETLQKLRKEVDVQMIVMGGIAGASDIRRLEEIDKNIFIGIGTALAEMDSDEIREYFNVLDIDLRDNTDFAKQMTKGKECRQYQEFRVDSIEKYGNNLKLIKFDGQIDAGPGQYVFVKVDNKHSKPFSVANDKKGLEIVVKKVGETTSRMFDLRSGDQVKIRGPYGACFELPKNRAVVYVGAGCGIAPIHHAATHYSGKKTFVVGAKTAAELVYMNELKSMGTVVVSTDDGSFGRKGVVADLLKGFLATTKKYGTYFLNCGPEVVMDAAESVEKIYTDKDRIYHLVERMTSCGVGICGKCSIPYDNRTKKGGKRACVDGPVFSAIEFNPGLYRRDKAGNKVKV